MATSRPRLSAAAPYSRAGQGQDVDLGLEQEPLCRAQAAYGAQMPSKARDYETALG